MAATKPSTTRIKKTREEQKVFFVLDLHKKFLQVAAADQDGSLLMNKRVENDFGIIEQKFSAFPKNAKYALESSSMRYGVYRKLAGNLGLDVILPNPYLTRLIAKSKKKIGRFDARTLADRSRQRVYVWNLKMLHSRIRTDRFHSSGVRSKLRGTDSFLYKISLKFEKLIWTVSFPPLARLPRVDEGASTKAAASTHLPCNACRHIF